MLRRVSLFKSHPSLMTNFLRFVSSSSEMAVNTTTKFSSHLTIARSHLLSQQQQQDESSTTSNNKLEQSLSSLSKNNYNNSSSVVENPDLHQNWSPFSNRVSSLKTLNQMGIGRDPCNEYRVKIQDPDKVVKWARKVLENAVKEKNDKKSGSVKTKLKKWEKAIVGRLLGIKKQNRSTEVQQEEDNNSNSSPSSSAALVDEFLSSPSSSTSISEITNEELIDRTQAFLDDAFAEVTKGESNKIKKNIEPGTLTFDELNPEQQQVLRLASETGKSLFIGGFAGSGKTALIRSLHAHFVTKLGLKVALSATTGVAGVHVGGATFHSTVGVPSTASSTWDTQTLKAIDVLIVDEVSMLTTVLIDALDIAAKEARLSAQPFGGIQVILCGDFMQLVPEMKLLFTSQIFGKFLKIGLKTALRHRDEEFREALLSLRLGKFHDSFRKCFLDEIPNPLETDATFLFPRRSSAQKVNDLRLQHLEVKHPDDERIYVPQRGIISLSGNFSSACIVSLLPSFLSSLAASRFSAKKICQRVEELLNLSSSSNTNNNNCNNAKKNDESKNGEHDETSDNIQEQEQQEPSSVPADPSTSSKVFSMISRSGLSPQVVFRLKHPTVGKPEVKEEQWREAIQVALSEVSLGISSSYRDQGKTDINANANSSLLSWHFEEGDCSDMVSLQTASALGLTTTSDLGGDSSSMMMMSNSNSVSNGGMNNNTNNINNGIIKYNNTHNGYRGPSPSINQSNNGSSQQQHQQPVRLRLGCRVMVNRNLSKEVVNGSIGEIVRFEEPDPKKFPFAENPTMMRLWNQKGGKQAVEAYEKLPVIRLTSNYYHRKDQQKKNTDGGDGEVKANDENTATDVDDAKTQEKLIDDNTNTNNGNIEFQIPPMFVSIGGGEETNYYQQSSFYMPLLLGYAHTIHKCQGLSISGQVVLDLRELTYKCPHLVYVACSRVFSLDQLKIVGLNPKQHLTVNKEALEFSSSLKSVEEVMKAEEENNNNGEPVKEDTGAASWFLKRKRSL